MRTAYDVENQKYRNLEGWTEAAIMGIEEEEAPAPAPAKCVMCEHYRHFIGSRGHCRKKMIAEDFRWVLAEVKPDDPADDCPNYKESCPF